MKTNKKLLMEMNIKLLMEMNNKILMEMNSNPEQRSSVSAKHNNTNYKGINTLVMWKVTTTRFTDATHQFHKSLNSKL